MKRHHSSLIVQWAMAKSSPFAFWRENSNASSRMAFPFQIQLVFKVSKSATYSERFSKNILSGGCAGSLSLCFVQSIDYTRTRLATDAKNSSGKHQFNEIIDVYVKTLKTDGLPDSTASCKNKLM